MADNGQDIETKLSIILEDKFSTPMKKLNTELHDSLVLLAEIGNKLGSLENINLERLTREMKNVKDAALSINTPTHKIDVASGVDEKTLTSLIRAEAGHQRVQNALGRKEVQNYDKLLDMKVKELEEKEKQIENRTKELENRLDKKIREDNVKADTENKSARARLNNAKADALISGGQMQYTSGKYGAFASILGAQNMRFKNKQGLVGYATRFGARLADNKESWFGKAFGKDSGINNLFGGALRKGTINGLGINAGGLALGGFVTAVGAAANALNKFTSESMVAFGNMQKLATSMEVVFGSRTQSNEAFGKIQNYATRSPFGIEQTTEMAILLKQSGVYASELQKTLEMIGDVSSGNEEKMKRIANNYAQIQAIGHANMLDMRQFAYAGLPIYEEVAKTMGKTQAELRPLIQEGKVTAEIIEQTFQRMTGAGGTFYKAVNKGAKNRASRVINLEDIKNIEKANYGEFLWDFGGSTGNDSIAQRFLSFKENYHKGWGNFWENRKINQGETLGANYAGFVDKLTKAYAQALKDNNEPLAKKLSAELDKFASTIATEDDIRAKFAAKGYKEIGLKNKKEVSDELYNDLYNEVVEILQTGYWLPKGGSASMASPVTQKDIDYAVKQGSLGNINITDSGAKAYAEELLKELETLIPTSKVRNNLEALAKTTKKAHLAFAVYSSKVRETSQEYADSMNKLSAGENSLTSRTAKYKELWKSSPMGKEEQRRADRKAYDQYVKDFDKASLFFDASKNKFNMFNLKYKPNGINNGKQQWKERTIEDRADSLRFLLGSNFISSTSPLDLLSPHKLLADKTDWNTLFSNIEEVQSIISLLGVNNKKLSTSLNKLAGYKNKEISKKTLDDLNAELYNLKGIDFSKEKNGDILETLIRGITSSRDASGLKEKAKYYEDSGDQFIKLWKRIFANPTGWDASKIWKTGGGVMEEYRNFQNRDIVSGGVEGLVKSKVNLADIFGNRMIYTKNINNQEVRQIDWEKTEAALLKDSINIEHGTKETANVLSGLAESMQNQLSVYDKLKHDFISVGEDWSNISKFGRAESERLEQAFGYKLSEDYTLGYDKELGFVVKDSEGNLIDSVDKLKAQLKNNEIKDESLKAAVDKIEVDSIIPVLDEQRSALQSLTHVVETANSIAQKSNEYQRQAIQTRTMAYGSSYGVMGNIYNGTLTTRKAGTDKYVRQFLSSFISQVADIDTDMDYKDFENQNPSMAKNISEKDFNAIKKAAEVFRGDDIEQNANALKELLNTFPELFKKLVENAEKLAQAEEEADIMKFNSALLDSGKMGFWGGVGVGGGNSQNSWAQNRFMKSIGLDGKSYKEWNRDLTRQNIESGNSSPYKRKVGNFISKKVKDEEAANALKQETDKLFDTNNLEEIRDIVQALGGDFDKLTGKINKTDMAMSSIGSQLGDLSQNIANALEQFGTDAITSSMEILGEYAGKGELFGESLQIGADASKDLKENFRELSTSLMSNLGVMITEAGLSMMIHANSAAEVAAGLGLAAMGGGFSFLSGYMNGMADDDKEDDQLQRLLKVKEDLADLLKQAREDAIYYENTMRHKTAISANKEFTTKKVNDAIITPSGNVISTHPDDYLIATKTPQTLVGRSGSPKINFNLIDKSTGIKVTTQKANYDEKTNTLNFEALIESKVQEVIATSKGDDAFAIRQARENGKSVIA